MTLVTNTCCSPTARGTGHPLALRLLSGGTGHPLALRLLGGGTGYPLALGLLGGSRRYFPHHAYPPPGCSSESVVRLRQWFLKVDCFALCRRALVGQDSPAEGKGFCLTGCMSVCLCLSFYLSIYLPHFLSLCVCMCMSVMVCFSLFRFLPLSSLPASNRIFLSSLPESLERISLYISVSMTSFSTYFTSQF